MISLKESELKHVNDQLVDLRKEISFLKEKRTNDLKKLKQESNLKKLNEICFFMSECLEWKNPTKDMGPTSSREKKTKQLYNEIAGYNNAAEIGSPMETPPPQSKQKITEMMDVYYELNPIIITILGILEKQQKQINDLTTLVTRVEQQMMIIDNSWIDQLRRFY
jgi:hypothetical protein